MWRFFGGQGIVDVRIELRREVLTEQIINLSLEWIVKDKIQGLQGRRQTTTDSHNGGVAVLVHDCLCLAGHLGSVAVDDRRLPRLHISAPDMSHRVEKHVFITSGIRVELVVNTQVMLQTHLAEWCALQFHGGKWPRASLCGHHQNEWSAALWLASCPARTNQQHDTTRSCCPYKRMSTLNESRRAWVFDPCWRCSSSWTTSTADVVVELPHTRFLLSRFCLGAVGRGTQRHAASILEFRNLVFADAERDGAIVLHLLPEILPWPKKNWDRHASQTYARACSTDHAPVPRARGCLNFFGQGGSFWNSWPALAQNHQPSLVSQAGAYS